MSKPFNPADLIASGPVSGPTPINRNDQLEVNTPPNKAEDDKPFDFDVFDAVKNNDTATIKQIVDADKAKLEAEEKAALERQKKEQDEAKAKENEAEAKDSKENLPPKKEDEEEVPPTAKLGDRFKPKDQPLSSVTDADLTALGVAETAIPLLRKASKETQEYVVAEFRRRNKELETTKAELDTAKKSVREGLPNAWYEHDKAYTLTPEYQDAIVKANQVQGYSNHFRQQLIAVKEGEKWFDLSIQPDGTLKQEVKEPGPAAEVYIMDKIRAMDGFIQQKQQHAQQIASSFQTNAKNLRADMTKLEDQFFPYFSKDFDKNEHGQFVLKAFASKGLANNPTNNFTAKLYAAFMDIYSKLEAYEAADEKKNKIAKVNNGPTGNEINKGEESKGKPSNPDDEEYDDEAFQKVRNKYN